MKQKFIEIANSTWQWIKGLWPWYKSLYKGRPWYVKTLAGIVSLIAAFFIYLGAVDMNFLWLFGKSPSMATIKEGARAAGSAVTGGGLTSQGGEPPRAKGVYAAGALTLLSLAR